MLAVVLAVGALAGGKYFDGRWPVANYRGTIHIKTGRPELWNRQAPEIEQALRTAAGPYADRMEIGVAEDPRYRRPAIRISFIATDENRWNAHWFAMVKRLSSILPADTYIALDWQSLSMSHDWRRLRKEPPVRHFLNSSCILIATALSALLAASVTLSRWWRPLVIFAVGVGVLVLLPPLAKDPLVDGDLLPPLRAAVLPADFSTPETAARSVLDAAHAGDLETLKRGMSRRNRTFLNKRDGWEIAMENLGRRAVVGLTGRGAQHSNRSTVERKMRGGSGTLDMLLEDGEWRLDELPFDVPEMP